ncbi:MAG TPA: hypothetical protein VK449_05440 [Anaerolineales bacterium]|nr:hypothetical protein [Anaerolineales bacterium]
MDYGSILKKSWEITWKNKGLWILGILSGCTSGVGHPSQTFTWKTSASENPALGQAISRVPPETWLLIAGCLLVFILVFVAVVIVLSVLGQAGLIAGVGHADETGGVKLGEAWNLGRPHFWRLLGLAVLLFVVALLVALLVGFFVVVTFGLGMLCLVPLICLGLPLAILISAYLSLVQNDIVLGKRGVFEGLGEAWRLMRAHCWPVVLMGVILFAIGLVAGFLLALPMLIAAIPLLAVTATLARQGAVAYLPMVGCFLLYLPFLIVLGGILKTYVSSVWTLTYRRLTAAGAAVVVPAPG